MLSKIVKYRVWFAIAALAVITAAWYLLVFNSQLKTEAALKVEQQSLNETIAAIEQHLSQAKNITGNLCTVETRWNVLTENLVSVDRAELILERIRRVAETNKLNAVNMNLNFDPMLKKVGTEGRKAYTDRIKIDMNGQGRFFGIGDFIDSLESDGIIAGIDNIKLIYQSSTDPEIYFAIVAEVFILSGEGDLL
jgi:Tfp pilus assembly protein PilO